jgi:hypothetical protein
MKKKPEQPGLAEITKSFGGDDGAAAWMDYAMSQSRGLRSDMDALFSTFCAALSPVVKLLQQQGGLSEAAAIDRAFSCVPTAYAQLRAAQNLRNANASRASDEAIAKKVSRVATIAKALVNEVANGGAGTAEARLLATAAAYDWET